MIEMNGQLSSALKPAAHTRLSSGRLQSVATERSTLEALERKLTEATERAREHYMQLHYSSRIKSCVI
jgi:hypothetical protein